MSTYIWVGKINYVKVEALKLKLIYIKFILYNIVEVIS